MSIYSVWRYLVSPRLDFKSTKRSLIDCSSLSCALGWAAYPFTSCHSFIIVVHLFFFLFFSPPLLFLLHYYYYIILLLFYSWLFIVCIIKRIKLSFNERTRTGLYLNKVCSYHKTTTGLNEESLSFITLLLKLKKHFIM